MQKQSIRSLFPKFLTERCMSTPVRTEISVRDLANFEFFLDSCGMQDIKIGFYEERLQHSGLKNYIVYDIPKSGEASEIAMMLTLQHGSLEAAYLDYRDSVQRKIEMSTF
jgi:hypothetical protein